MDNTLTAPVSQIFNILPKLNPEICEQFVEYNVEEKPAPNPNVMSLEITKTAIVPRKRSIKAQLPCNLSKNPELHHNIDVCSEISQMLSQEIVQEINNEIIQTIGHCADENEVTQLSAAAQCISDGELVGYTKRHLAVYTSHTLDDDVLIGYKGRSELDAGIKCCPYIPLIVGEPHIDPDTSVGVVASKTQYGINTDPIDGMDMNADTEARICSYYRKIKYTKLPAFAKYVYENTKDN